MQAVTVFIIFKYLAIKNEAHFTKNKNNMVNNSSNKNKIKFAIWIIKLNNSPSLHTEYILIY